MLMLWLTDVLRPPPTRVGRVTANFALPRAIPAPQFAAAISGAIAGLLIGATFFGGLGSIAGAVVCAFVAVWLVSARPWRGRGHCPCRCGEMASVARGYKNYLSGVGVACVRNGRWGDVLRGVRVGMRHS